MKREVAPHKLIGGVLLVVSLAGLQPVRGGDDGIARSFAAFCQSWMDKLGAREAENRKRIAWRKTDSGFEGEYIGYSRKHACNLKTEGRETPIGKVTYREVRYRKRGKSPAAAEASPARVVEITEVTEIFRYAKGKWVY